MCQNCDCPKSEILWSIIQITDQGKPAKLPEDWHVLFNPKQLGLQISILWFKNPPSLYLLCQVSHHSGLCLRGTKL